MSLGAGMYVSFCTNRANIPLKIYLIQLVPYQRCLPRFPAQTTSLSGAHNETLQFSTFQNQPRQIHQWLGLTHLAVPSSRCGVRLPLALVCVWGAQESLTLHIWGRTHNKFVQVLSQTRGWGSDSITGNPCAVLWLLHTCTLPLWISFLVFSLIKALKAYISLQEYWEAVWSHSLTPPAFIC